MPSAKPNPPVAETTARTELKTPSGNAAVTKVGPASRLVRPAPSKTAADIASANNPTFYSLDGSDIHVDLPDGRKAIITSTPRTLDKAFWRAAQRAGAVTQATAAAMRNAPVAGIEDDPVKRRDAVKKAIEAALKLDPEKDEGAEAFTPAGLPNASWVSTQVGFPVSRQERDDVWNEIQVDLEKEDAGLGVATNGKARVSDDDRDNA